MTDPADFALHPALDPDTARAAFARDGRVHVAPFLIDTDAGTLADELQASAAWRLIVNAGERVYEIDRPGQRQLTAEARARLDQLVDDAARDGFQHRYEAIRVPDGEAARAAMPSRLHSFARFLSSPSVLGMLRTITGDASIAFADAQATRYGAGHFLTAHDDDVAGKSRRAAYVLGLTPGWRAEWGGLLMFHGPDGHIARALVPGFNVLTLFAVPQPHSVSYVAPFAPAPRLSVTGWLRAGER